MKYPKCNWCQVTIIADNSVTDEEGYSYCDIKCRLGRVDKIPCSTGDAIRN